MDDNMTQFAHTICSCLLRVLCILCVTQRTGNARGGSDGHDRLTPRRRQYENVVLNATEKIKIVLNIS